MFRNNGGFSAKDVDLLISELEVAQKACDDAYNAAQTNLNSAKEIVDETIQLTLTKLAEYKSTSMPDTSSQQENQIRDSETATINRNNRK